MTSKEGGRPPGGKQATGLGVGAGIYSGFFSSGIGISVAGSDVVSSELVVPHVPVHSVVGSLHSVAGSWVGSTGTSLVSCFTFSSIFFVRCQALALEA